MAGISPERGARAARIGSGDAKSSVGRPAPPEPRCVPAESEPGRDGEARIFPRADPSYGGSSSSSRRGWMGARACGSRGAACS